MIALNKRNGVILLIAVALGLLSLAAVGQLLMSVTIDLRRTDAVDAVLFGQEADDRFGKDLATGDINGDGIADLAVGAFLANGPENTRSGAGEVYVYYGQTAQDWPPESPDPDVTIYGPMSGTFLGSDYVSQDPGHMAVGDLDGDGVGDLILGASSFGHGSFLDFRGRAWIIWGQDDLPATIDLNAVPLELEVTTVSAADRDFVGAAVAAGDLDGDGVDDLAVSAPGAAGGAGIVYVLFGDGDLRKRSIEVDEIPEDILSLQVIGAVPGTFNGTALGSYLAVGDLSGDGVGDLAIGAEHAQAESGMVSVIFGGTDLHGAVWDLAETPANWSAEPEASMDRLGSSLAIGDLDADSQADLLMGAPSADGPAGVNTGQVIGVFGPLEDGVLRDLGERPGDLIVYGPQGGTDPSWLGESIAVGDFNDDNVGDLIVGARQANALGRGESGIIYVFHGDATWPAVIDLATEDAADLTFLGAFEDDFTGYVAAGDLTGDEVDDMAMGADWREGPNGQTDMGAVYILFGSEALPTPLPTLTPTATPTITPTPTQTATPTLTPTRTPEPREVIQLPLIMRNRTSIP